MAASFLGFGWCEPMKPLGIEKVYNFQGIQGPDIHWPGEEEFFGMMPCNRSSYRIVMPDTCNSSTSVAGCAVPSAQDTCDLSTITTAYFNIGRSRWMAFSRPDEEYFGNIHTVMSLANPMVIYTEPEFVDRFVQSRKEHGRMDRTIVIGMSLQCTPAAHYAQPAERLMCKRDYLRGALVPHAPERQHAWYNVLMYNKAFFFRATQFLPQVATQYHIWLDAGCHYPMCRLSIARTCLKPSAVARPDRLRMAQTETLPPDTMAMDPVKFTKTKHVHFAGTIFGTGADNMERFFDLFVDTLNWMFAQGAVDQDQSVFAYIFMRHPEEMDPYFVDNEWVEIVDKF